LSNRILITGGAGFFGHHFVEHVLKNTDWSIVVLDSLNYASFGFDRLRDIGVYDNRRIERYVHNVVSPIDLGLRRELGSFDYIIHAAAETHVDNSIKNPAPFVETNIIGTFRLLEYARSQDRLKKFVYFSTDEVFGPAKPYNVEKWLEGDHTPDNLRLAHRYHEWDRFNPTNPYSATKAAGEDLVLAWANTYGLPVLVTHCMNIFGERQHPEKFIPLVIRKILAGEEILIHSSPDGKPGSRFYIHARNVSAAVLFMLKKVESPREKYNITGEVEYDNEGLAFHIGAILGISPHARRVDFHSSRPGHDLRYALSGDKLATLGWKPPVNFDESLERTVNWFASNKRWLRDEEK